MALRGTSTAAAGERVRLQRQLAEIAAGFRDAARRRQLARSSGDFAAEAAAQTAIEASFRARDKVLGRLRALESLDAAAGTCDG